jgi:hypothetical protein
MDELSFANSKARSNIATKGGGKCAEEQKEAGKEGRKKGEKGEERRGEDQTLRRVCLLFSHHLG